MTRYAYHASPIGALLLVGERGPDGPLTLSGLYMEEHRRGPAIAPDWARDDAAFEEIGRQLDEYFAGRRSSFDLPLSPCGTPFQHRVWDELRRIEPGTTRTYGELAAAVGRPRAARAVGAAIGRNPISVIVPCHRVVGADGSLTGFGGGLERKRYLLALEGAPAPAAG